MNISVMYAISNTTKVTITPNIKEAIIGQDYNYGRNNA